MSLKLGRESYFRVRASRNSSGFDFFGSDSFKKAFLASPSLFLILSFSSEAAAFVKVTTRISSTGIFFSRINLKNKDAIVWVLPVPALASIRLVPVRGALKGSIGCIIIGTLRRSPVFLIKISVFLKQSLTHRSVRIFFTLGFNNFTCCFSKLPV